MMFDGGRSMTGDHSKHPDELDFLDVYVALSGLHKRFLKNIIQDYSAVDSLIGPPPVPSRPACSLVLVEKTGDAA
jgi:hypothetical protein